MEAVSLTAKVAFSRLFTSIKCPVAFLLLVSVVLRQSLSWNAYLVVIINHISFSWVAFQSPQPFLSLASSHSQITPTSDHQIWFPSSTLCLLELMKINNLLKLYYKMPRHTWMVLRPTNFQILMLRKRFQFSIYMWNLLWSDWCSNLVTNTWKVHELLGIPPVR